MEPRARIDVDEWQRGMVCATLVAATVAILYGGLDFAVTTLKAGVVSTWNTLALRVQRTMESLVSPVEDLLMNADELGAASLFERFPYPAQVNVGRRHQGGGNYKVMRFVVIGSNLDVLREVRIDLDGVAASEEAHVDKAPLRDSERWEFAPTTITAMTAAPARAVVTVIGYGGSRWRHVYGMEECP
jgi:hypothetical protein